MYKQLFLLGVVVIVAPFCACDTSFSGCSNVLPMANLKIDKLMGVWYVIQKTSSSDSCLAYNFTHDENGSGKYRITQIRQHDLLSLTSLHYEDRDTMEISVPNLDNPGKFDLHIPYSLGTTKMTVFITDYDNYLGVYYCKQTPLVAIAHRWSAEILTRKRNPDMENVDKVRTRLSTYNVDPFSLSMVSQSECPEFGKQGSILQAASNIYNNIGEEISNVLKDGKQSDSGQKDNTQVTTESG